MRTLAGTLLLAGLTVCGCSPAGKDTATKPGAEPTKDLMLEIDPDSPLLFDVVKGKSSKHPIKLMRQEYKGDLALEFDVPADAGLKLEAAAIPAGRDEVEITITADADAKGGRVAIKATAPDYKPKMLLELEIRPQ